MATLPTHLALIKLASIRADARLAAQLKQTLALAGGLPADTVRVFSAIETAQTYVYLPTSNVPDDTTLAVWLDAAKQVSNANGTIALLTRHYDLPGASAGAQAPWHYIVETDVVPDAQSDLNAWYDTEHMPGLAAVPGTVRAQRYVNPTGTPRYHACYDLHTQETFGSPPWLAVRATDWSARVRPNFRNTIRTMFTVVG